MAIKVNNITVIGDDLNVSNVGVVTATSFSGSAAGLTNVPAGPVAGEMEAVASGSISDGSIVVVNNDGTVGIITANGDFGTPVVYESATTSGNSMIYDPTNQKVVIAYRDSGNSNYGTAVVGTVSGTSISLGTPVVFESSTVTIYSNALAYDSTNGKVVIVYVDDGNSLYGTAVVGTVSGTSISFGTPVVYVSDFAARSTVTYNSFDDAVVIAYYLPLSSSIGVAIAGTVSGTSISFGVAATFNNASTDYVSITYDSFAKKVVISYRDFNLSNKGASIVGDVNPANEITFGTSTAFPISGGPGTTSFISSTYDSTNGKVIIAYKDGNNSNYGTAIVGTVSGTSISFGTPSIFYPASIKTNISTTYDSTNQIVVVGFRDDGDSNGKVVAGTVSGTSISFGPSVTFQDTVGVANRIISLIHDSTNDKIVIAYGDDDNSFYGTAVVFNSTSISTNLTATNFLGISAGTYTNGQTATIQITGSADDAQTGLTTGSKYYVQNNGTLSTTPDTPSVLAGTAMDSNKILIGEYTGVKKPAPVFGYDFI